MTNHDEATERLWRIYQLQIDHLCRVKDCCNPGHLEAVTPVVNMQRAPFAQRTHCPAGHAYSEENTYLYHNKHGSIWRSCKTCSKERSHIRHALPKPS